jgi:flagellin
MSISVNTNAAATTARNHLLHSHEALGKNIQRLSSGKRLNNSSDDSAAFAVSTKLNSQQLRNTQIVQNLNNSMSFLQVQHGVLKVAGRILNRMSELKMLTLDVTKNVQDMENYNKEFLELQKQLAKISQEKFNGVSLFTNTSVVNHALQQNSRQDGMSTSTVSIARNFLAGEYIAASGAVLGGKIERILTTSPTADPISTAAGATGVDTNGNKIAIGATDANWTVTGLTTSVVRVTPNPAWAAETATSSWVGLDPGPIGDYFYSMSFDLTGCDPNTVQISGLAATDNQGRILVNGQDMGISFPSESFRNLQTITLQATDSGILVDGVNTVPNSFVNGVNNITVKVDNSGGATGLLFDQLDIQAAKVTEVTTNSPKLVVDDLDKFSMDDFGSFLQNLSTALAQNGVEQQRITKEIENRQKNLTGVAQSIGRIEDLDFAEESTRLARNKIINQSSASMLAQANQLTYLSLEIMGM